MALVASWDNGPMGGGWLVYIPRLVESGTGGGGGGGGIVDTDPGPGSNDSRRRPYRETEIATLLLLLDERKEL